MLYSSLFWQYAHTNCLVASLYRCILCLPCAWIYSIIPQELHDALASIPACYLQTAVTMLYVLHELAKNPDVQAQLAREVTGVLGSSPVVTEEHIQHLHYLKGCIKESLR